MHFLNQRKDKRKLVFDKCSTANVNGIKQTCMFAFLMVYCTSLFKTLIENVRKKIIESVFHSDMRIAKSYIA